MRNKKVLPLFSNLEIIDIGAEGQGIAKHEGLVVFIPKTIPGDIVNAQLIAKKKNLAEGKLVELVTPSPYRISPLCSHFDVCGGCKWQNFNYEQQLIYKEKQVKDALLRIGKIEVENFYPIVGSELIFNYRNKLDYGFTAKRWLYDNERDASSTEPLNLNALGFHIPGRFDKIFNVTNCQLQPEYSNQIRNAVFEYANKHSLSFFNLKEQTGLLRSLIVRNNLADEWMVIIAFKEDNIEQIQGLMEFLKNNFTKIVSLYYVINQKRNDTIFDLPLKLYYGKEYLTEELNGLKFKINPKSFFQTNPLQTHQLYKIAYNFAELTGNELVYDLYTGTGTIANYIARYSKKVVGIEYVEEAIVDARENAKLNHLNNIVFYSGDMKDILTSEFVANNGKPDTVIVDPPRAGMHESVVKKLLEIMPQKIVYVSCNPATQARDLVLLQEKYNVTKSQAVDMFPHTQHVENVVQLRLK